MKCTQCKNTEGQHKDGFTGAGSQRYRCYHCGARYTPNPKQQGYSNEVRFRAIRMYVDGMGFRQIGRHLQVDHVSVMNWVEDYASQLPDAPVPEMADTVEMDEIYTFIGKKKKDLHPNLR
jgi:transposase-like protein